jgi:hypothetical protein
MMQEAFDLLNRMASSGVVPDQLSFQRALLVCARTGNLTGATALLKRMGDARLPVTVREYTSVITCCA